MAVGGITCLLGLLFSVAMYYLAAVSNQGTFLVAGGTILYGGARFLVGVFQSFR